MRIPEAQLVAANPRAYTTADLRLARLKLFGTALKQFPSSPRQQETHDQMMRVLNELKRRAAAA